MVTRQEGDDARARTLDVGRAARLAALEAHRPDPAVRSAARWPNGPGPITHGTSSSMTRRCRTENGEACATCRAGDAARMRDYKRRRGQK